MDAIMVETIIGPTFGYENTTPFTTQIKKSTRSNIYRVTAPWRNFFAALGNTEDQGPDLDIDVSDPTDIVITQQSINYSSPSDGEYSVLSRSCFYSSYGLPTPEQYKITLTEDGNGRSTITFPYLSCLIHASTAGTNVYGCLNSDVLTTITFNTFSGVSNNIADEDNSNAPVEYFNLQGVRVANPASGQLVIRRQGSNVSKIIVR